MKWALQNYSSETRDWYMMYSCFSSLPLLSYLGAWLCNRSQNWPARTTFPGWWWHQLWTSPGQCCHRGRPPAWCCRPLKIRRWAGGNGCADPAWGGEGRDNRRDNLPKYVSHLEQHLAQWPRSQSPGRANHVPLRFWSALSDGKCEQLASLKDKEVK